MSGFQIPGLGQAKPNEVLPPQPAPKPTADQALTRSEDETMANARPASPPSITHALEAALGGLEESTSDRPQPAVTQENEPSGALPPDTSENPEWEIDSSPYESSESSSSESSDSDSDNEGYELLGVEETARLLMQTEGASDDEGDRAAKGSGAAQLRTKNEVAEQVTPKPEVEITADMDIQVLGHIEHVVENVIVITAVISGEYQVLDTGSVLCTAERAVVGVVSETIGKVQQPMYTVRFNNEQEIKELGLGVGTRIYYPIKHAAYVFTQPLKNMKGSDASNLHDEEIGDEEMEFSDDEKEAEYRRALKQKKKWKAQTAKGMKEPHPLRQEVRSDGGLNYDDNNDDEDDDGPYKPLTRPPGYGSGPVLTEPYEPPSGRSFPRGGRRNDSRGRGSRGRGYGRGGGRGGYSRPRDGFSLPPQGSPQEQSPWSGTQSPTGSSTPPTAPSFGFQFPSWPQSPVDPASPVPPPPPGWPAIHSPPGQQQPNNGGAFVNPAFLAALMSQMQAQNGQQAWGGQQQQPPRGQGQ